MKQLFKHAGDRFCVTPHAGRAPRDARPVFLAETPADLMLAGIYQVEISPDGQERCTFTQRWIFDRLIRAETMRRSDGTRVGRSSYGFDAARAAAQAS